MGHIHDRSLICNKWIFLIQINKIDWRRVSSFYNVDFWFKIWIFWFFKYRGTYGQIIIIISIKITADEGIPCLTKGIIFPSNFKVRIFVNILTFCSIENFYKIVTREIGIIVHIRKNKIFYPITIEIAGCRGKTKSNPWWQGFKNNIRLF